jgi:hypothetical protein
MGKDKRPRKPKPPAPEQSPSDEELVQPPARPVLYELFATIRAAVGAMLDIADAAARAITERLEGRA